MARGRDGALNARMRLCLKLRQGAGPLRPPAPFPSGSRFQNGGDPSRVRKPRKIGAPLTDPHRSEDIAEMRERGLLAWAGKVWLIRRGDGALRAHEALPQYSGQSPLKPLCRS